MLCGIHSGLKPTPAPAGCTANDQTNDRVSLGASGRARLQLCNGDVGPYFNEATDPVLRYGTAWRGRGVRCASRFAGLTCTNRQGHGFFLARERYRLF